MGRDFQRGARMSKHWDFIPAISVAFTGDNPALGGSIAFARAQTVIRMIGSYTITATTVVSAQDSADIGLAIGVISTDAFVAGASAVPDPLGEPDYPWLFWADESLMWPTAVSDQGNVAGSVRRYFDIKSMRKLKPRESLAVIFQYSNNAGNPPITVNFCRTRVLLAE